MATGVVSERFRFVWIHLPKNASSTLSTEFCTERYGGRLHGHLPPPEETPGYFTFAFLRDPVSRLLSAYQEVSIAQEAGWMDHSAKRFVQMDEGIERFRTFVDELGDRRWDPHIREQAAHLEGRKIDFFGCVERLRRDLARVYARLGMGPVPDLPRRRSREGRIEEHGYGRHLLRPEDLDDELVARIREIYREDVELYEREIESGRTETAWCAPRVEPARQRSRPPADDVLPFAPWRVPAPPRRGACPDPAALLRQVVEKPKRNVRCLEEVPARLVTATPVRTRMERPRSTRPEHRDCPFYPQLEQAFLLQLDDAFIGDNVVMDDEHYFGLGRHWLGSDWRLYEKTREVRHIDAGVSIGAWGGEAFQLFILAGLPKLGMVIDLLESPGFEHVKIVSHDEGAAAARWFWEALGLRERVFQKPKNAQAGFVVHADRVYFPQYTPTLNSYGLYARNSLRPVRRRLGVESPGEQDLVVYLDRPDPKIRSVANREALLEAVARRLAGTGLRLEIFHPEGPENDRHVFGRARVVLGPHGGGFANMIFARPGTHVIEFLPIYRLYEEGLPPRPVFWGMAQGCGLPYWTTEPANFDFQKPGMVVDVDDVVEILGRALDEAEPSPC